MGFSYDTWGGSWGSSWGISWGNGDSPPPPEPTPEGGGRVAGGGRRKKRLLPTADDYTQHEDRSPLGIARRLQEMERAREEQQRLILEAKEAQYKAEQRALQDANLQAFFLMMVV